MTFKALQSLAPQKPKEYREQAIWRRPSLGPNVPVKDVQSAPSSVPTTLAAMLWPRERPNSGPKMPKGTTPTWMFREHQRKKIWAQVSREVLGFAIGIELTFQIDGGSFFSSRTRSIPCVSTPIFASSLIERHISENPMQTTSE
jgi:hypothetical protein